MAKSSEAETVISRSIAQHSTHSDHSSSSSSKGDSSHRQETSGRILHCHIDWDKDDVGSHEVAVKHESGATDSPVRKQTADGAQQKSYVVLSVSLKNGKVSGSLTSLSMRILLQYDALCAVALCKMQKTVSGQLLPGICLAFLKLTVHCPVMLQHAKHSSAAER